MYQVLRPFRHRPFRTVWSGETLSMVGDFSFEVAFVWLVFRVSGSAGALAAVLLVQAVPRGVLLLVGGVATDRLSSRTVMLCSHLTRGIAFAVLGTLAALGDVRLWQLYVFGAIAGVADAFFWPASDSILPSLLPAEDLPRGNALVGFGAQGARLVGPVLGGALVASVGSSTAILLNSASFFVAALTLLAAPRKEAVPDGKPPTLREIWADLTEGLHYARSSHEVITVLMIISAAALSYSGLFAVGLPALAKTFPQGSVALGLLLSAWGLGQLAGTVAAAFTGLPHRWGLLIIGMTVCEGTAFVLLGLAPSVWLAALILVLLGIGVAYSSDVALPTFIQTRTPADVLGRVNSVMNLPRVVLEPVSLAVMGLLVTGNLRWAFALAAVPTLAVGIRLAFDKQARSLSTTVEDEVVAKAAAGFSG